MDQVTIVDSSEFSRGSKSKFQAARGIPLPETPLVAPPSEEVSRLEEQVASLRRFEALYHQLKKQFEEKGKVLEATRSELFRATTALETQKIAAVESDPSSMDYHIAQEFESLEKKIEGLVEENRHLQDLVTRLMQKELG